MENSQVAQQIQAHLAKTGKKQYELASEIGTPEQTVSRWLTGKTKVSRAYQVILRTKGIIP